MKISFFGFLTLVTLSTTAVAQQPDAFLNANQEYAAGHFREAIALYESVARDGAMDATVFYNLANAYFRVDELGRAILNYERALALEPRHPEAAANLRLVRDKARGLELKRNPLDRLTSEVTPTQYVIVAVAAFWIALFAFAASLFARRRSPALTVAVVVSLLILAIVIYGLYAHENGPGGRALAIVTAKSTDARLATADSAGTVLTLPPGSQVKILSTRGDWTYAALPNELRGWIPAQSAELVRR